jgi:hypothetical protein
VESGGFAGREHLMGGNRWTSPDTLAANALAGNYAQTGTPALDSTHWYQERGVGDRVFKVCPITLNNTTGSVNLFQVTGAIKIFKLWGIVVTATVNGTNASFDLYDGTATIQLTKNDGVFTALPAGSWIGKTAALATTWTTETTLTGNVYENAVPDMFYQAMIVKKATAPTYVRLTYKTTDAPAAGSIKFYAEWRAMSDDGLLVAV